ncbi:MAG: rhomboid family intramembrane serine protease [Nannocystaceae bacterium]
MNRDPTSPLRRHPGDFGALFPWCITIVTGAWMAAVTWFHLRSPSVPAWRWWEAADSMVLSRAGAGDVVALWVDGQWWRVATAWLLHGSWLHWLINMVSLHSLWPWCVAAIGTARTFGALGLGSVVAVLASSYAGEGGVVVGLSGGLFGMAAVVMYERRGVCQEIRRHVGIAVLACLVLGIAIPWLWPQGPRLAHTGAYWGDLDNPWICSLWE